MLNKLFVVVLIALPSILYLSIVTQDQPEEKPALNTEKAVSEPASEFKTPD